MSPKLFGFTIMLFGLIMSVQTVVVIRIRDESELLHAMIVNSNIRDYDQALYLMSPDGVILRRLTDIPGSEWIIDQSPNGKWLLIRSNVNFNTYSVNIGNGTVREIADLNSQLLTISPDSRWAYFQRRELYDEVIYRVALGGGHREDIATTGDRFQYFSYGGLSPDGDWLYISNEQLIRIHTDTHEAQVIPNTDLDLVTGPLNWATNGTWMYVQGGPSDFTFYRMRPDGSDRQPLLPNIVGDIYQFFMDPQNDRIYLHVNNNGANRLYSLWADGSDLHLVTEQVGTFVAWTADPQWALFLEFSNSAQNELYRMNVTDGRREMVLPDPNINFWMSPNQQELAFFLNTSALSPHYYLKNITESSIRTIAFEEGMRLQTWSPDSQWIYFDKMSDKSSELFRINVFSGERQTVHTPALHNNYQPIFGSWTPISSATWRDRESAILSLFFLWIIPTITVIRNTVRRIAVNK